MMGIWSMARMRNKANSVTSNWWYVLIPGPNSTIGSSELWIFSITLFVLSANFCICLFFIVTLYRPSTASSTVCLARFSVAFLAIAAPAARERSSGFGDYLCRLGDRRSSRASRCFSSSSRYLSTGKISCIFLYLRGCNWASNWFFTSLSILI